MSTGVQIGSAKLPFTKAAEPPDPIFRLIRDLIYKASGIFQLEEKLYLLADGCGRRMKALAISNRRQYWDLLSVSPGREAELRQLLNEITIGETCLFRSQPQLDAIRKVILPELAVEKRQQESKKLRIWSAGCSTGEESYTLAMSMLEEASGQLKDWTIEIFATDLNDRSLETAQAGIYGDYALRNTSDYFKLKYFSPVDGKKFQVKPQVKKLITFRRLNLQDHNSMFMMRGMDVILCCNVLIYFDGPSKTKVVEHFFNDLNTGGYFFLGASESLLRLNDKFHLIHFPGAIAYWKPSLRSGKL